MRWRSAGNSTEVPRETKAELPHDPEVTLLKYDAAPWEIGKP